MLETILAVIVIAILVISYAVCVAAGRADERAERMFYNCDSCIHNKVCSGYFCDYKGTCKTCKYAVKKEGSEGSVFFKCYCSSSDHRSIETGTFYCSRWQKRNDEA